MALTTGTRLGPYEIVAPVGAGGMGEVYRAQDTRLNRAVAVKILPAHLATRTVVRERFEREARAISSLNHPHICSLYDIGRQGEIDFLVMEYLQGETLGDRLQKGALPQDQSLRYAGQILDALDRAHRNGIVHRDLKPANVMLTRDGAKLLDFGLAKLREAGATLEQTVSMTLTREGTIVGTFQYMAPEQLEGQDADARTDIFAFGAVLYEMLTGRKAFSGRSQASLISSIMTSSPPPASAVQPTTPPALDRLVRRCLEKDPDERWQSARDLGAELAWIASGSSQAVLIQSAAEAKIGRSSRGAWILAVVLASILAFILWLALVGKREVPQTARLQLETSDIGLNLPNVPMVSPDGSRIIFNGTDSKRVEHIWIRPISSFECQMIAGSEGGSNPFWSPDGNQIGFSANNKLLRLDLRGGAPQLITDGVGGQWFNTVPSWSPAGIILFDAGGVIKQISALGSEAKPVTRLDNAREEIKHGWPQFLPDGRHFLYLAVSRRAENSATYLASLDSPQVMRVTTGILPAVYTEPGFLLTVRGTTLMAQPFDWKRARLTGEPLSVAEQVNTFNASFYPLSCFSVGRSTIAYRPGGQPLSQLAWYDRRGRRLTNVGEPAYYTNPALSPEGKQVLVPRAIRTPGCATCGSWMPAEAACS
jgi:serine/threonine protein kinase